MRQNRDEIIEELRGKRFCKDFLVSQLKDLYTEQNVAISNEDFAVADKINQEIERKQTELDNLKFKHPIIDNKVFHYRSSPNLCPILDVDTSVCCCFALISVSYVSFYRNEIFSFFSPSN